MKKLALCLLTVALLVTPIAAENLVPRRVLLMHDFWESGTEAMVIEDAKEVRELFALFDGNETVQHACGYHWAIVFEDSSRRIMRFLHNKECETYLKFNDEIHSRLQRYFHQIDTAPAHYLMHVELDPSAEPAEIAALLERDGRRAFLLEPPDSRFPRLLITKFAHGPASIDDEAARAKIEASAREKLDAVIELLKTREHARVYQDPIQFMSSSGGNEYEYGMRATVVFPLSFDAARLALYRDQLASGAKESAADELANVDPPFERPFFYILTLASPKPFSKKLADLIRAASPAVRGVTPVETKRLDE